MDSIKELLEAYNKVASIRFSVGTVVNLGVGYWLFQNYASASFAFVWGGLKGIWGWIT